MSDQAQLEPAPIAAPVASPRQLVPSRFQNAEHARTVWRVVAEEGMTLEDVLKPIFWAHVGHLMQRFDIIEVLSDDEAWFVQLIVRDSARGYAKVTVLSHLELDAEEINKTITVEGFEVAWKGPKRKHVVIRQADRTLLKEGFSSKTEAMTWAQDLFRAGGGGN